MPPEAEAGVPEAKQPWNVHARKREHDAILLSVAPDGTADLKVLPVQHPNPRIQREQIRKVLGVKFSNKPAPGCWSRT
jgi:hypothetical protein